jgi:Nif-specific regulatory protein/two-component system response regulator HydG
VRVVAATHQDLGALIAEKRFRQDLYFRLKVVELTMPPLRDRRGDIPLLAESFLGKKARPGADRPRLTPRAEAALEAYGWPGNIRELESAIERACLLARGPEIDLDLLPAEVVAAQAPAPGAAPAFRRYDADELAWARAAAVEAVERDFVSGLLARAGGNVSQAARESGLNRTYLQKLLARYRDPAG